MRLIQHKWPLPLLLAVAHRGIMLATHGMRVAHIQHDLLQHVPNCTLQAWTMPVCAAFIGVCKAAAASPTDPRMLTSTHPERGNSSSQQLIAQPIYVAHCVDHHPCSGNLGRCAVSTVKHLGKAANQMLQTHTIQATQYSRKKIIKMCTSLSFVQPQCPHTWCCHSSSTHAKDERVLQQVAEVIYVRPRCWLTYTDIQVGADSRMARRLLFSMGARAATAHQQLQICQLQSCCRVLLRQSSAATTAGSPYIGLPAYLVTRPQRSTPREPRSHADHG